VAKFEINRGKLTQRGVECVSTANLVVTRTHERATAASTE